jgi:hypothetical protein
VSVPISLPDAALQNHVAVLGKTGSGKTSTAKLIVEAVVAKGARVCVLDPIKSDWWGVTSSADGKKPGLPFHILGGPHGHVALHSRAGAAIGELVGTGKLPLSIVDMADFEAGGVQRFFVDFIPALMKSMTGVLYVVWEEAHEYAPKERSGFEKENMAIHYAKKAATAGRSKGIRLIVATQATQLLHNRILGSCETMIVHRFTAPADQKPVVDWLKSNTDKAHADTIARSISSLKTGEAWVVSGEAKILERRQFPKISTYDNSATPTDDGKQKEVKTAPVDGDKLRSIIGDAVKEAEANDPAKLKGRIAELEREIRKKDTTAPAPKAAIDDRVINAAQEAGRQIGFQDGYAACAQKIAGIVTALPSAIAAAVEAPVQRIVSELRKPAPKAPPGAAVVRADPTVPRGEAHFVQEGRVAGKIVNLTPQPSSNGNGHVAPVEQRILNTIAGLGALGVDGPDKATVAALVGYHPNAKSYSNAMGSLRSRGYIEYLAGGRVGLTADGSGIAENALPIGSIAELHQLWFARLGNVAKRILDPLLAAYPEPVSADDVAGTAGYHPNAKSFSNMKGRLRTLGLVDYPSPGSMVATKVLFPEGLA